MALGFSGLSLVLLAGGMVASRGFAMAAGVAAVAALVAAFAIATDRFFLFCTMMLFPGGNTAFVQQYRFAAAESVDPKRAGRAISLVLAGGIVTGFLGPEIGRDAKDRLGYGEYSGSFVAFAILLAISVILLLLMKDVMSFVMVATPLSMHVLDRFVAVLILILAGGSGAGKQPA